jgi:hypothetical protein
VDGREKMKGYKGRKDEAAPMVNQRYFRIGDIGAAMADFSSFCLFSDDFSVSTR